jgi:hypothetical protein
MVRSSKSVMGLAVNSSVTPKNYLRSVDLAIPLTHGVTECHTFMDSDNYEANAGGWPNIELYVSDEYEPPLPLECWTASSIRHQASESVWLSMWYSIPVGLFGSIFLNYMLVRIPFGSRRQSLNERWGREWHT